MIPTDLLLSAFAFVLGALVSAAITYYFNLRHALKMEREQYRRIFFRQKLEAYRQIADALQAFTVFWAEMPRGPADPATAEALVEALRLVREVELTVHRHTLFVPTATQDRILRHLPAQRPSLRDTPVEVVEDLLEGLRCFAADTGPVRAALRRDVDVDALATTPEP